jgi:serine/threonine-protein kinase
MIGKTISHYRIIAKLGEGGMGVVYRAEDTKLGREVALKFLSPDMTRDDSAAERFVREAKAAAALNHPNICTVHEINEADGQTFIAMECVEGENLRAMIKAGALELNEAIDVAIQVAEGLAAAHEKGIVHRDIKPANIVVTPNGQAKIMDFGLVSMTGGVQLTRIGTTVGTVAYMSPEQAHGETVDHQTDIWSLGVVLYEMLAGKRPFTGDRDQTVIYSILNDEPESVASCVPDAPPEITGILLKALAKEPAARYQSAGDLAADLGAIRQKLVFDPTVVVAAETEALPSIAVLPFTNMSPDPENDYFGDGMAEELANALAQLPQLRVAARTSAFQFRGKDSDVREIAAKLNVGTVLEGSVRKAGSKLRVTAQLISVSDGFHMWSDRYDREMEDIFAVQDEITAAIVDQLKMKLGLEPDAPIVRRHTDNLDAYALYLKGLYYWNSLTPEGLRKSRECYEKAIEIDPDYALAHAALSMWHQSLAFWADAPPSEAFSKSRAAAERALEIDETVAIAHNCLAVIHFMHDWDWERAEREFERAIALDPSSPFGHLNYAFLLTDLARHEDALRESGIAQRLDPLSTVVNTWAASLMVSAGRVSEGIAELEEIVARDPGAWQPHLWISAAYSRAGMRDPAIASAEQAAVLAQDLAVTMTALASAYVLGGRAEDGGRVLKKLQERAQRGYVSPTLLAFVHVARGAIDDAVECAERAYDERDHWLRGSRSNPAGVRFDDPRLQAILQRIGLP